MARKVTTLFIRDNSINLLVMKGDQVQKWANLPLEPGLVSHGVVLDETLVAGQVRELFKLAKVTTRKVIAGLSGLDSLYRLITLPELPEAILDEAIRHEAGRVVPVSLDEVYLSYQLMPAPTKGEQRLFLAAFPRNVVDALIRTLHKANVEPYLMDLAPLALCRIPDEPRAIIVNARLDHLEVIVIANRLPEVIRRVSLPSEAESLSEKLPTIIEELSRTVAFYDSNHLEQPLDSAVPLFVCGELAEAPETWQSLVGRLNYSVSPLAWPVEYPEGFPANEFMVNIGLALKELLPEKGEANFSIVNLNTLPEVYLPKAFPVAKILAPVGIVVGIGLLVYAGFIVQNSAAHTVVLRSQLSLIESSSGQQYEELAALKGQITQVEPQIEPVEAQIEQVAATTGVFKDTFASLKEGREQVDGDLNKIAVLVPEDIALLYGGDKVTMPAGRLSQAEINHDTEQATIKGVAPGTEGYKAIFEYAKALRSSRRFSAVIISSIEAYEEEDGDNKKGFNFTFLLK